MLRTMLTLLLFAVSALAGEPAERDIPWSEVVLFILFCCFVVRMGLKR